MNNLRSEGMRLDCRLLLTLPEAAKALSVGTRTVRRLIERGELPKVKVARCVRVPAEAVQAWMDKQVTHAHNEQKITKRFVDSARAPERGQALYWDTELPGFGLRVGAVRKAFFAEGKVKQKTARVTVGTYPRMTPEIARKEARKVLSDMELGIDPRQEDEAPPLLDEAFERFTRVRTLATRTRADYGRYLNVYFVDLRPKPVTAITPAMVSRRHLEIADRHGQAQANAAMRFLRSLLYFCRAEYGKALVGEDNPVRTLGEKHQWFRELPRQGVIKTHELPTWFLAVRRLTNDETTQDRETVRDLLQICLFLGLRKGEALRLRKADIDLKGKTLAVRQTKNYEPRVLPFGPFVAEILERRLLANPESPYVFGSTQSPQNPISEPKRTLARVVQESGVQFSFHDLRRSFATLLEGLDVSVFASKRLMGHKTRSDDVLGRHYVVTDVERLRAAIEKLETFILRAAGVLPEISRDTI